MVQILLSSRLFGINRKKNAIQEARNAGPTLSSFASRIQAVLSLGGARVKIN